MIGASWLAGLLVAAHPHGYQAGWVQNQAAGATPVAPRTMVALYHPTAAPPRAIPMGPFTLDVASGGRPVDKVGALIRNSRQRCLDERPRRVSRVIDALRTDPGVEGTHGA